MIIYINSSDSYTVVLHLSDSAKITIHDPYNINKEDLEKMILKQDASIYVEYSSSCSLRLECKYGIYSLTFEIYNGSMSNGKPQSITSNITLPSDIVINELTRLLHCRNNKHMAVNELVKSISGITLCNSE